MDNKIPLVESISLYDRHIFFCSNVRNNGKKSCGDFNAQEIIQFAKNLVLPNNIEKKIRISSSGCLGKCEFGPLFVIYPNNLWFTYESKEQVSEIFHKYVFKQ